MKNGCLRKSFEVVLVELGRRDKPAKIVKVRVRTADAAKRAFEVGGSFASSSAAIRRATYELARERAIQKAYGSRAYWWGDSDPHLSDTIGQIVEPMPRGDNGSRALTGRVRCDVCSV